MFIDTHAHITQHDPSEIAGIVSRAAAVSVGAIITAGVTVDDSRRAIAVAREHERIFAGVGVHPTDLTGPLTDEDIARIAGTYHAWRGDKGSGKYEDIPGFCKSAATDEIAEHGHVLTPGRYVGAGEIEGDDEPFEEKMQRLTGKLHEQFAESRKLEKAIRSNLEGLGYEG